MYTRITGISRVVNVDNRTFLNNTIANKSKFDVIFKECKR